MEKPKKTVIHILSISIGIFLFVLAAYVLHHRISEIEIQEVLIHPNYLSQKDIEICIGFDVTGLSSHEHFDKIQKVHDALIAGYKES